MCTTSEPVPWVWRPAGSLGGGYGLPASVAPQGEDGDEDTRLQRPRQEAAGPGASRQAPRGRTLLLGVSRLSPSPDGWTVPSLSAHARPPGRRCSLTRGCHRPPSCWPQ